MNVNNNDPHQKKTTCTFLYIQKEKKIQNVYIYKKPDTSKENKKICVTFFKYKKPDTLRYAIFHEIFEIGIYIYRKRMTLCVT